MKNENIQSFAEVNFASVEDLPNDPDIGDTYDLSITIFRTGAWSHPWYGDIDFDKSYLESMINNFNNGVVDRRIGFNTNHRERSYGNVAWVNSLELRKGSVDTPTGPMDVWFLDAEASLNSKGIELLKDKRYAHISAEVDPDYSTNEKYPAQQEETEDGDATTEFNFGPTLTGVAFTNKPFIPSLGDIVEFSDGEKQLSRDDFITTMSDNVGGVKYYSYKKSDKLQFSSPNQSSSTQVENVEEKDETKDFNNNVKGDNRMKLSDILEAVREFETLQEQIEYLEDLDSNKFDEDGASGVLENILESKRQAYKAKQDKEKSLQKMAQKKKRAEKRAEEAEDKVYSLESNLAEAREGEWSYRVKSFCQELEEEGHHQSVVNKVEEKLDNLDPSQRKQKYSFEDEEGEKEQGIIALFQDVLSVVPENARLNEDEELQANQDVEVDPDKAQNLGGDGEPGSIDESIPEEFENYDKEEIRKIKAYHDKHGVVPEDDLLPYIEFSGNSVKLNLSKKDKEDNE